MHEIKKTAFFHRGCPNGALLPPSILLLLSIELIQVSFFRLSLSLFPLLLRVTKRRSLDFVYDYFRFTLPHDTSGQNFDQNIAGRFQTKKKKTMSEQERQIKKYIQYIKSHHSC